MFFYYYFTFPIILSDNLAIRQKENDFSGFEWRFFFFFFGLYEFGL